MFVFCLFGSLTEPLPCKPNAKFSLFFVLCSGVLLLPFHLFRSHTSTALTLAFCPLVLSLSSSLSLPLSRPCSLSLFLPLFLPLDPSLCLHPLGCPLFRPLGLLYLVFSSASACCFRAWSMDSELSSKPTTSAS